MTDDTEALRKTSLALKDLGAAISESLEGVAGQRLGFALVVFTGYRAQYISNCDRAEVVKALQGLLDYWKANGPDVPAHEVQ